MKPKGVFIVLEGPDKSGKSTHAKLLAGALTGRGLDVVHTREPGGSSFAEAIRGLLLDPAHRVHPLAELLLYEASRAQHTHEVVLPALARGAVVVSERYTLATLAYQGYGRGLPLALVRRLNRAATGGLAPDLTLILDIPDGQFAARASDRAPDRLERESGDFRRRVRRGYRALARIEPRTRVLDATAPKPKVHDQVLRLVLRRLAPLDACAPPRRGGLR